MQLKHHVRAGLRVMPQPEIRQDELAYLQSLRNQMEALQNEMRQVAKTVFMRLDKGANIEPGAHQARIEELHNDTHVLRRLVLNGLPLG